MLTKWFLTSAGIVLMCLVSYNMILWWVVCAGFDGTFEQTKREYLDHYPTVFRNPLLLTGANVLMGVAAGVCFLLVTEKGKGRWRPTLRVLAVVNLIFAAWNLFSLM